jgi:hypothetical protein
MLFYKGSIVAFGFLFKNKIISNWKYSRNLGHTISTTLVLGYMTHGLAGQAQPGTRVLLILFWVLPRSDPPDCVIISLMLRSRHGITISPLV